MGDSSLHSDRSSLHSVLNDRWCARCQCQLHYYSSAAELLSLHVGDRNNADRNNADRIDGERSS